MVYTSKRGKFSNFFKTGNWKYYAAVLLILIAIMTVIVLIAKQSKDNPDTNDETDSYEEGSTSDNESVSSYAGKYRISVNLGNCQIAVYPFDDKVGEYSQTAVKYMLFSYSDDITEGTYTANESNFVKSTWYTSSTASYYRYYVNFGSNIIFHSAAYTENNNKNSLSVSSYNNIGSSENSSDNENITLLCSDARWIYENCSAQSEVVVYTDAQEQISMDITEVIDIPSGITWDPTDSSNGTPWCQTEVSTLNVNSTITVEVGASQITSYASATDTNGGNVAPYIYITGSYNLQQVGSYTVVYNIADIFGNHLSHSVNLVVTEEATTEQATETVAATTESNTNSNTETEPSTTTASETSEAVTVTEEESNSVSENETLTNETGTN